MELITKVVSWEGAEKLASLGYPWKVCIINTNGKHNKFWEISGKEKNATVYVRYGKIGAEGTIIIKNFAYAQKKLKEKMRKSGDAQYRYDPVTDMFFPATPEDLKMLFPESKPEPKPEPKPTKKKAVKKTAKPKPAPQPMTKKQKLKQSIERRMREAEW
jgi:predicted DNA-binding WGR domain protein